MATGKARVYWSEKFQKQIRDRYHLPKNIFAVKLDPAFERFFWEEMKVFQSEQEKRIEKFGPRPISLTMEWEKKKRSLDQNAYMWKIYELKATIMNDGIDKAILGARSREEARILRETKVTPKKLYDDSKMNYAPRYEITCLKSHAVIIREEYLTIEEEEIDDYNIKLLVCEGSSHYTTAMMAEWLTRELNELSDLDMAPDYQAIAWGLWRDYRSELADNGIDLDIDNDVEVTQEQYKATHPLCEATGKTIYHEESEGRIISNGSLAHIKSRGSDTVMHSNYTSNWLHLTDKIHALWDNGNGREKFLQEFPHLKRKIENALGKEYPPFKPTENVDELELF